MINTNTLQTDTARDVYTDLTAINSIRSLAGEDKGQALEEIAKQFESMMVRMMVKSMRSANDVFAEGNYMTSHAGDVYQGMYDDQLSLTLAQGRGLGIADVMVRQLKMNAGIADRTIDNSSLAKTTVEPRDIHSEVTGLSKLSSYLDHRVRSATPRSSANSASNAAPVSMSGAQAPDDGVSSSLSFDGSIEKFVDGLYSMAERAAQVLGVDPKVLIAQAALETGWGKKINVSDNGSSSFNMFNIKADSRWQGETVSVATMEVRDGMPVRERAAFRAYTSPQASFDDYVDFISTSQRYEKALNGDSSESYLRGLSEAGYATDPEYADKVLRILASDVIKPNS